jgi:hypothetical protein
VRAGFGKDQQHREQRRPYAVFETKEKFRTGEKPAIPASALPAVARGPCTHGDHSKKTEQRRRNPVRVLADEFLRLVLGGIRRRHRLSLRTVGAFICKVQAPCTPRVSRPAIRSMLNAVDLSAILAWNLRLLNHAPGREIPRSSRNRGGSR